MGSLLYGMPPQAFEFDDRTLAHLEIVIVSKLRRNESFTFATGSGSGARVSIWLNSAVALQFRYDVSVHEINRVWLEQLVDLANTPAGLRVVSEPST